MSNQATIAATETESMDKEEMLFKVYSKQIALEERMIALASKIDSDLRDIQKQVQANSAMIDLLREKENRRQGLKDGVWWIIGLIATVLGILGFFLGRMSL